MPQKRYTLQGHFWNSFYATFFAAIGLIFFDTSEYGKNVPFWTLSCVFALVPISSIALHMYRKSQFRNRTNVISRMALDKNWEHFSPVKSGTLPAFALSSVSKINKLSLTHQNNNVYTPEWAYCDFSYDVYRETKYGQYKEAEIIYAMMGTVLPRKLPNIIFDSLRSRKRQFRLVYDKSQRHSLEGDFDEYFDTYFPKDYTIDSLSFITPDVMEALINASEYDIELIDNNLFIYGPVGDPRVQLPAMSEKLARIKKELLDNILTYRDERLPYAQGRQEVAVAGARLASAKKKWWVGLLAVAIYYIVKIYFETR